MFFNRLTSTLPISNFSSFYQKCSIGEPDLSKFFLIWIFSNVSNISKECLKCPLNLGIIFLSKMNKCDKPLH
jgi:hypothetical protein